MFPEILATKMDAIIMASSNVIQDFKPSVSTSPKDYLSNAGS
jgi:hypothetical protein